MEKKTNKQENIKKEQEKHKKNSIQCGFGAKKCFNNIIKKTQSISLCCSMFRSFEDFCCCCCCCCLFQLKKSQAQTINNIFKRENNYGAN